MKLLTIDTTTEYLSIAVTRDGKLAAKVHRKLPMMHSTRLVPAIANILKKARMKLVDLDGFCVSVGPGSFTGLRIGVTTVKGLSYATGKPVVTVPTLDAIAHNAIKHKGVICPILDARKGKVYACIYRSDGVKLKRLSKHLLLPLPELMMLLNAYENVLLLGDMVKKMESTGPVKFSIAKWHPRAEIVARYGMEQFKKRRFVKAEALEPMYLYSRECDITGK